VRDWSLRSRFGDLSFLHLAGAALNAVGLSSRARLVEQSGTAQAIERLNLDGLLALWHPPTAN
jgi:protease-4